jgi:LmbE family N-acetylglucosaminyl deacetylase
MRTVVLAVAVLILFTFRPGAAQSTPKTLVAVWAHADDEGSAAPILARYAREGAQVYIIIATDGAQGGTRTSIPRGVELAGVRREEARCATDALGLHPPILLGFPDGQLGAYTDDPTRLYRLTQQIHQELQRLHPDAMITWGPDGGTGHPDHRLVSGIVTQLARAGAPGVPERLFYAYLPVEAMRAMNPSRGEPPLLIPQTKYFTMRIPFTMADFDAALRSMACHKTQLPEDLAQRAPEVMKRAWNGVLQLIPAAPTGGGTDLFPPR